MHEQMIDLAHPGGAILFRLLPVLQPQTVQHVHLRILLERTVQVVRHLGFGPGSLTGLRVCGLRS